MSFGPCALIKGLGQELHGVETEIRSLKNFRLNPRSILTLGEKSSLLSEHGIPVNVGEASGLWTPSATSEHVGQQKRLDKLQTPPSTLMRNHSGGDREALL